MKEHNEEEINKLAWEIAFEEDQRQKRKDKLTARMRIGPARQSPNKRKPPNFTRLAICSGWNFRRFNSSSPAIWSRGLRFLSANQSAARVGWLLIGCLPK